MGIRRAGPAGTFAIVVGAFLLIEGILGLRSPIVFGLFTTNTTHATIHILLGLVGLAVGISGKARHYCLFLGALLLAVGVLRFVPGIGEILVNLLNVNYAVAVFNIVVGIASLLVARSSPQLTENDRVA
ncbi:MAG: DUF4383 domain-containing protein [Gemmatimonadaceae bacterium]|nr:DUF4383 domain-containing protein [Gemmatimonadaceae bacterium]